MVSKSKKLGSEFRPHFKTHQSIPIGRWFRDEGISGITVSSPGMAAYFINDGWDDITIGFPFYQGMIEALHSISKNCNLRLFLHEKKHVELLSNELKHSISALIEINAGYNRSGINYKDEDRIQSVIDAVDRANRLDFHGFYIHDGDTYSAQGQDEVFRVMNRNLKAFTRLKKQFPEVKYCLGDTPTCSLLEDQISIADELSPGNLIFYDLMQIGIGSCGFNDIGLLIKAPVAQEKSNTDECIIHGGAVHFSKDRITLNGTSTFGQPVLIDDTGSIKKIEGAYLSALSQEHGTVKGLRALKNAYNTTELEHLWICPVHSCLTANLYRSYYNYATGKKIEKKILS